MAKDNLNLEGFSFVLGDPCFKDTQEVVDFWEYLEKSTHEDFSEFERARRKATALSKDRVIG